jgi:hypothetical protein
MKDTPTHGSITLAGTVRKLIDLPSSPGAQQAQIALDGADYLYDEVRVANVHKWPVGNSVEITIKAR